MAQYNVYSLVFCVSVGDEEVVVQACYEFEANAETIASNIYPVFGVLGLERGIEG